MPAFQTVEPKNAQQICVRLSTIEKIDLRSSSDARIEYLAREKYRSDGATYEELLKVRQLVIDQFTAFDNNDAYWKTSNMSTAVMR